ncbi:TlpA disulfide reductase family protein [Leptobacterium sp. I13]|uniref:TlpA family protein disulfide reductase n=1 Tax=Leptobacterium meishanense TaxID=3128904 RepID=UPI0030EF0B1D
MKITRKSIYNLLVILIILAFFVTPLGDQSKILLNRIFASSPYVIEEVQRKPISDFDWKLKDDDWNFFNFEVSKGNVIFVHFWASWQIPSIAELHSIQKLYDNYKEQVDFYIITNEEKEPVETFMKEKKYTFPVTYLIIGEKMPFNAEKIPSTYILDKEGDIAVEKKGIANWNSNTVKELLDNLIE